MVIKTTIINVKDLIVIIYGCKRISSTNILESLTSFFRCPCDYTNAGQVKLKCLCKNNLHFITDFFFFRTDVDMLLDDIVSKEPLITPSKMEQVRKLIISILYFCFLYCISQYYVIF